MIFAKLYEQSCGKHQILVRIIQVEEDCMGVAFSTYIEEVGLMEVVHAFKEPQDASEAFEMITEIVAVRVIKEALGELKEQTGAVH